MSEIPQCDRREVGLQNRRGKKRPGVRPIRQRPSDEARRSAEIHLDMPKGRKQPVSGCLAHCFLARPVPKEGAAALVGPEATDRGAFRSGQELARQSIGSEFTCHALNIDADAHGASVRTEDADQRYAAGVRDVEVEPGVAAAELGATSRPANNRHLGGTRAQREAENFSQRSPARDPSLAQRIGAKASSARVLGRRERRGECCDRRVRVIELTPPQRHVVCDLRELARPALRIYAGRAH